MKKKLQKTLLAFLTILGALGCSKDEDDASKNLSVDIGDSDAILIPATTKSCREQATGTIGNGSVASYYFELRPPVFTWNGDQSSEIRIVAMKLSMDSTFIGKYECLFAGDDLGILWNTVTKDSTGATLINFWDGFLGVGTLASRNAGQLVYSTTNLNFGRKCNITCGGVAVPPNSGRFSVKGRWEVIGVQRKYDNPNATDVQNSSYQEFPIDVRGDFSVRNALTNQ